MIYARMNIDPRGYFDSLPSLVGSSDEEIVLHLSQGTRIDGERKKTLAANLTAAAHALAAIEPAGRA